MPRVFETRKRLGVLGLLKTAKTRPTLNAKEYKTQGLSVKRDWNGVMTESVYDMMEAGKR